MQMLSSVHVDRDGYTCGCSACAGGTINTSWAFLSPGTELPPQAPTTSSGPSGNQDIDGLLFGTKWAINNFTFSFPTSASFYDYNFNGEVNTFGTLSAAAQAVVRGAVLPQYAAVANLTFTEVTETSTTHADLRYADSDAPGTAWAYYPSTGAWGGDVWVHKTGTYGAIYDSPVKGNYAFATYLHETGHALGLKHGHETGGPANIAVTPDHDSMEYTIMTYRSYVGAPTSGGYTNETWGYAQTPMMLDVAALQYMYGADFTTNSGNSVYTWNPTTGEMSIDGVGQGAPGGNRILMNVWDGNGTDTYNFSNYTTNISVNLNPGEWVNLGTQLADLDILNPGAHIARGNISNSLLYQGDTRSLIENAYGGSGNDTITGNAAANLLLGGAGDDRILGGLGNDTYLGGSLGSDIIYGEDGNDRVDGGADNDILFGGAGSDSITGDTGNDAIFGDDGSDRIAGDDGADTIQGGSGDDVITGDNGDDVFLGGDAGSDYVYGDAGNDRVDGGADRDYLFGGIGNDTVTGGAGDDFYIGGDAGDDVLYGDDGNDRIDGGADRDFLFGGIGNDTITGGAGDDFYISGDDGSDVVYGEDGNDRIDGGLDGDILFGGNDNDTITGGVGNDALLGDAGNDRIEGGDGADQISGGSGEDVITGDDGDDVFLAGDAGADYIYGDAGNDRVDGGADRDFLFGGIGNDTITGGDGDDFYISGDAGADHLYGDGGNDRIDGGADFDVAYFSYAISQYTIQTVNGVTTVSHLNGTGANGIDTITNVELLHFADSDLLV